MKPSDKESFLAVVLKKGKQRTLSKPLLSGLSREARGYPPAGDYGKPRPAVVVQSDWLRTDSVLVGLITSAIVDAPLFRLCLEPNEKNGLRLPSQIMVDKILAMPREKCGAVIGRIDDSARITLNHMLSVIFGLAD